MKVREQKSANLGHEAKQTRVCDLISLCTSCEYERCCIITSIDYLKLQIYLEFVLKI